jgi:succinate dehydrogenase / fumarate reductase cytochrome b subunit
MGLSRRVGFFTGLRYRGGGPMWSWMLHRITGVALLALVSIHLIASFFMQQTGSELATSVNSIYESWFFQILVTFIVVFHGLNGLRIAILDLLPGLQLYQRQAIRVQLLVFIPIYGLIVYFLIQRAFSISV